MHRSVEISLNPKTVLAPPPPTLHLELWVSKRKDRASLSKTLRRLYSIARRITQEEGGNGPWVYLANPDSHRTEGVRLRRVLGLRRKEDLWVELAFYSNSREMRATIRKIWKYPQFQAMANSLSPLLSRRRAGYEATIALLTLKDV